MSKSSFFISCEEANHNCDKKQYREASFFEKIKLVIHLAYCRACRKYSKNNSKLTELVHREDVDCLEEKEKQVLRQAFQEELSKKH